ncbi:MAG: N-acetylglucosamine-6-phosphate deacetylase, partial [Planctomycetes bacterium]|nr:N-acetylglucosamine-6-phosphate deacetylase [Planctomycetota bacterium]
MKVVGRRYDSGQLIEVTIDNGRIASVDTSDEAPNDAPWIAPGFVDLQINGYGGQEFND